MAKRSVPRVRSGRRALSRPPPATTSARRPSKNLAGSRDSESPVLPMLVPGTNSTETLRAEMVRVLTPMMELLVHGGLNRAEIGRELRRVARAAASGRPASGRSAHAQYPSMVELSRTLYDWCREPGYVDANGDPRSIPSRGRGRTLETLIKRRLPAAHVPAAIHWLETNGIITSDGDGIVTARRRHLIARPGSGSLLIERALTMAAYYLGTVLYNHAGGGRETYPDRVAFVAKVPARHLKRFRQFVLAQGDAYLETVDNWLEGHRADGSGEPVVGMGVHMYLFSTPERKRSASREP
jgi:uncharacterized protein DUF6502